VVTESWLADNWSFGNAETVDEPRERKTSVIGSNYQKLVKTEDREEQLQEY
jgi:hypothetical protein